MRNYEDEYKEMHFNIDEEIFDIYLNFKSKGMVESLVMGKDENKKPVVHDGYKVVKISLDMVLDNYWTKCNHIGVNGYSCKRHLMIKGFQVIKKKYRMIPINELTMSNKIEILNHLRKII